MAHFQISRRRLPVAYLVTVFLLLVTGQMAFASSQDDRIDTPTEFQTILDDVEKTLSQRSLRRQFDSGVWCLQIPEISESENQRQLRVSERLVSRLKKLEPDTLDKQQKLTRDIFLWRFERDADLRQYYWLEPVLTPYKASDYGPITEIASAHSLASIAQRKCYSHFLKSYARNLRQRLKKVKGKARRDVRLPRAAIQGVVQTYKEMEKAALNDFSVDAVRIKHLDAKTRLHFQRNIEAIIARDIKPALKRIAEFIDSEDYRSLSPEAVGFGQYEQGRNYYRALVRFHTTLDIEPEEIFVYGEKRMAELQREMAAVRYDFDNEGGHKEFMTSILSDSGARVENADELRQLYQQYVEKIVPHLPEYFWKIPEASYDIRSLDPVLEATTTFGYFDSVSNVNPEGVYWFNARDLENKSTLEIGTLIYHEIMPGHHMQTALQFENKSLPNIRNGLYYTAYTEGWAEYATTVAYEVGMLDDRYARYGYLTNESFTVARLVLDVGMNYYGWDLDRARDYFREHTTITDLDTLSETLRYSTDIPGQALAYRIGHKWFEDTRADFHLALGAQYDIRDFHSVILDNGNMPLVVLEKFLDEYINAGLN